jgi:succinate dehydrogenase cytochrome b subunit
MADKLREATKRPRPLSPHMTIHHWPITMAASITHRATGIALAAGTFLVAWWLVAASSGPESGSFQLFATIIGQPLSQVVLFGFVWSLFYHLLNGIRHLAWDLGYGFDVREASINSALIYLITTVCAAGSFALFYTGHAGYLQQ